MITWYGVRPSAAADAVLRPCRLGVPVEALHHVLHDRGVALTREDEVLPGAEHPLEVVGARRREGRMHDPAGRRLLEPARDVTRHAVHLLGHLGEREAGAHVDRVDVGTRGQDRPHLGERQVLVQGVAPGEDGRRAVEDVRDPEGERAADHVLLRSARR